MREMRQTCNCLLFLLCLGFQVPAQVTLSVMPLTDSVRPYVAVLPYGSTDYNTALQAVTDARTTAAISPILPFSVIVKNVSQQALLGTILLFDVEDASGKTLHYRFTTYNRDPTAPGLLQPGGSRFVSISDPANQATMQGRPEIVARLRVPLAKVATDLRAKRRITVSVDGLVTERGAYLGPDTTDGFRRMQAEQQAEAFVAARLARLTTQSEIVQELTSLAALQAVRTGNLFDDDYYDLKISSIARLLQAQVNRGHEQAVAGYLASLQKRVLVTKE